MTNINPNDDVGKINHIIKKENRVKNNEKPVAETKQVEASSLDALNSYGKASITFRGVETKQETVTREQVLNRLKEIKTFYKIKEVIMEYANTQGQLELASKILSSPIVYNNDDVNNYIDLIFSSSYSDENCSLKVDFLDKYLSNPKLYKNENLNEFIGFFLMFLNTKEGCSAKIKMMDKYISDENWSQNESIQKNIVTIFSISDSIKKSDAIIKITDKFLSDSKLYKNKNIQNNFENIIRYIDVEENADKKIEIMDKFLSDSKLYENENFKNNIGEILSSSKTKENANSKKQLIDKYLSDPKLYENKNIQKIIGDLIKSVNNKYSLKLADKFLSNPVLYENKNFQNCISDLAYYTDNEKKMSARMQLLDKFLSDSKLYENKNLQNNIADIISRTYDEEGADAKKEIIDKFLFNCELYENENFKKNIGKILLSTYSEQNSNLKLEIIDEFLFNSKLYQNESIQKNIGNIINRINTKNDINIKRRLIDKFLLDHNWYENKEIKNNIGGLLFVINTDEEYDYALKLVDEVINNKMSGLTAVALIQTFGKVEPEKIMQLEKIVPTNVLKDISQSTDDLIIVANLVGLYDKNNINEISLIEKREILRSIIKNNKNLFDISNVTKQYFPLIPKNTEEYCTLLPALVKSLGIETNEISTQQEQNFDNATKVLSSSFANLSDEEFNNLSITQEYSKDNFIQDTLSIVKDMQKEERQKVYDYFGFELHHNKKAPTGYSIVGYPVNLNNGKKLAQIEDEKTKQIVEQLRPYVIKFSENNKISCDNKDIEIALNKIASVLPEIRTFISKTQHGTQDFDIMKHSLKVIQKIVQNPKFEALNDSDKKIMILASLLHDSAKSEGKIDPIHAHESSFDAFYISQKFNLTKDERIKLYSLIDHHEWFADINKAENQESREKQLKTKAFNLQYDNLFELSKIFTEADLKAIKDSDLFFDRFKADFDIISKEVEEKIKDLKKTQPLLPTTKLPKASDIKNKITTVNEDCSTNIKGVYLKDELVVIKYNEVEDWKAIGLPDGSISRGIKTINPIDNQEIDTGNIKFIAHALDYANQLSNFDAFALPDSDALLSASYMERPESKYRLFRTQGVLLDVDSKYVHGGGETDSGSGYAKDINKFITNYAYEGSERYSDRTYISDLIKTSLNLTDKEYIDFVNTNKNKSMLEIEPKEAREVLIKQFALINSNTRRGNRRYNEMYVSNPNVQGVFAYSPNNKVGGISNFIDKQKDFLKDYAKDNDVPFVVFGN